MKKDKPNKKQQAMMDFLALIETEGLHYGLVHHGCKDELKALKDDDLTELVTQLKTVTRKIEAKIEKYEEEVAPFLNDDSDF